LLLELSDLPAGSYVQVQRQLVPGSWDNGLINEDGTDLVKGYITGERIDYMVPVTRDGPRGQAVTWAYVANLVYRFSSAGAAGDEFECLVRDTEAKGVKGTWGSVQLDKPFIVFDFGAGIPDLTLQHRWFIMQRDEYLVVLTMPGPVPETVLAAYSDVSPDSLIDLDGTRMTRKGLRLEPGCRHLVYR
jgi:hypothetical protein